MEHLHTSDIYGVEGDYQKFLPHLNVNLNTTSFPASPTSAEKSAKEGAMGLPYMDVHFGKKGSHVGGTFESLMSPPITPGDRLHGNFSSAGSSQVSSLLNSPMPTFSNDLAGRSSLQFNLSPPLTMSGSPDLPYGDLYHQTATQDYETYSEQQQPIYNFMGIDPNMQEQTYDEGGYEAPLSAEAYSYNAFGRKEMKGAVSDASLVSWNQNVMGSSPPYGLPNDWQQSMVAPAPKPKVQRAPRSDRPSNGIFECSFPGCEKTFSKHTNLKSHLRIHKSDRNYNCEDCSATFRRSHDLKRHQRSLHSDVKPYACGRCAKRFSRMVRLNQSSHCPSVDQASSLTHSLVSRL